VRFDHESVGEHGDGVQWRGNSVVAMSGKVDVLRAEVLALSESERATLAIDLLDSLDARPVEADQVALGQIWADEAARRAAQIDAGDAVTQSWDEVMAQVAASRRGR
jgi:putative addiction module component (TIGR02574 family)